MKKEYCADVVALYNNKLVLVERLSFPTGLALPGGRRDAVNGMLESVVACAAREFKEETGLVLRIIDELGVYDAPDRDPRGPKISTAVYGEATGFIKDEEGKTRVTLLDVEEIEQHKDRFVFDHYHILQDWKEKCQAIPFEEGDLLYGTGKARGRYVKVTNKEEEFAMYQFKPFSRTGKTTLPTWNTLTLQRHNPASVVTSI